MMVQVPKFRVSLAGFRVSLGSSLPGWLRPPSAGPAPLTREPPGSEVPGGQAQYPVGRRAPAPGTPAGYYMPLGGDVPKFDKSVSRA
eukprot:762440-Hanusia_phi.AAC.5